jgi:hypothetical protein
MKNTSKDKYEHKLYRFLKELDAWRYGSDIGLEQYRSEVFKKYGFTDKDWERAISLTRSESERNYYFDGIGYKKDNQIKRDKSEKRAERNGARAQYPDEVLEAQLKAEDDWILDVYDECYDEEDMHR